MLDNFLISVAAMAAVLGIMILVHEFGHFAVAKLLGVRVEQFAIGFGKRLVGFRKGGTDYRINLLPLGGYVKMAGENPMDSHTGDPGEFTAHPRWHRFLIAIAGPSMNILLAIVLVTGVCMVHYAHPTYSDQPAVVGYVILNSPAAKAGVQQGDRIVSIGGTQTPVWDDVIAQIGVNAGQDLRLVVQRGNEFLDKIITPIPEGPEEAGYAGWVPNRAIVVGGTEPGPAAQAGMRSGDIVSAIDGKPLASVEALMDYIDQSKATPVTLTIQREGQTFDMSVTPVATDINGQTHYRLHFFHADPVRISHLPFPKALARSLEANKRYSKLILELVQKLVERPAAIKQFAGPIGIGVIAGQAAREPGWTPLLELTALISLNLGIINLLPIPILDGGLILLLFVEAVIRRDISRSIKERIYQAAFVFLLLVGVIVIYNDLSRYVPGLSNHLP